MKSWKSLSLAVAVVMAFAAPALAAPVEFFTTGAFSAAVDPATPNVAVFGDATDFTILVFGGTDHTGPLAVDTPVGTQFGDIFVSSGGAGADISGTLTLTFFQTSPGTGSDSVIGQLAGELAINSGIGTLTFDSGANVTIEGVTYTLLPSQYVLAVSTGGTGGAAEPGVTTIEGTVTGGARGVPEPTSILLLGTGLVGLAGIARRKLNRR